MIIVSNAMLLLDYEEQASGVFVEYNTAEVEICWNNAPKLSPALSYLRLNAVFLTSVCVFVLM